MTPLISFITICGEPQIIYPLLALTYWCVNKRVGQLMLMSFALASFTNQLLKVTFTVYRPWVRSPLIEPVASAKITATGYSFPSGHVANASSTYGALAFSLQNNKRTLAKLLCLLIAGIMFSRNYLGVHTPQDVLVSIAVTVPLIFLSNRIINWTENPNNRDVLVMLVGIALGLLLAGYAFFKPYPMDYVDGKLLVDPKVMTIDTFYCAGTMVGFWLSWWIERRFVHYQPNFKSNLQRILVGTIGFSVLIAILLFLPKEMIKVVGNKLGGAFATAILIMFFIIVVYPWLVNLFLAKKSSPNNCI